VLRSRAQPLAAWPHPSPTLRRRTRQPLDLSGAEAQALGAHAGVVAAWGWRVAAASSRGGDAAAAGAQPAACSGLELAAIPLVCGVPLGALDLKLFLHQLAECGGDGGGRREAGSEASGEGGRGGGSASAAQPPGVGRVLRSRACRGAVMFNDALAPAECAALVSALAAAALPFCCAHGRPTTAPLVDLAALCSALAVRRGVRGGGGGGGGTEAARGTAPLRRRLATARLARLVGAAPR
jgi:DNA mismatch repair protein MLH3